MAELTVDGLGELTSPAANDEIGIWDVSAGQYLKIRRDTLVGGTITGGGTVATDGYTLTVPSTGTAVLTTNGLLKKGTYSANDTTPSVNGVGYLHIVNASPCTITDLDGGFEGQIVVLSFADVNTTLSTSSMLLNGPFTGSAYDTIMLIKSAYGSWTEISRSVNT